MAAWHDDQAEPYSDGLGLVRGLLVGAVIAIAAWIVFGLAVAAL